MGHRKTHHSRRGALTRGIGAAAFAVGAHLPTARASTPDFGNPADLLTAFVKTRGPMDGGLGLGWIIGRRYAVVDGRVIPMVALLANTFFKFTRIHATEFEMRTFEVGYYTDLVTGKLLDTWTNPITGQVCEVPQIRMGPRVVPLGPGGFDYNAVPRMRTMDAQNIIVPPTVMGDDVWITDESKIAGPPTDAGKTGFRYTGLTTYQAKLSDLSNSDLLTVPASIQYQSVVGFDAWMGMDGVDGITMGRSSGRRVFRIEDLPPYYLELTERHHPDVLNDPMAALMGPRGFN